MNDSYGKTRSKLLKDISGKPEGSQKEPSTYQVSDGTDNSIADRLIDVMEDVLEKPASQWGVGENFMFLSIKEIREKKKQVGLYPYGPEGKLEYWREYRILKKRFDFDGYERRKEWDVMVKNYINHIRKTSLQDLCKK